MVIKIDNSKQAPGAVCGTTSGLFYMARTADPRKIFWISLKRDAATRPVITLDDGAVTDMCLAEVEEKELLVVAAGGLTAYNTYTGKQVWNSYGRLKGMNKVMAPNGIVCTSNGNYLFVTDRANRCIQVFSPSNGEYIGSVIETHEYPGKIRWSKEPSSLVYTKMLNGGMGFHIH